MDNEEIAGLSKGEKIEPYIQRAIDKTDQVDEIKMDSEEILPPMTMEELDTFLTEEDARAEDERENPEEL